jgi:hypothetical protein
VVQHLCGELRRAYQFHNNAPEAHIVTFQLPFPAEQAIYDGVATEVNGRPMPLAADKHDATAAASLRADETAPSASLTAPRASRAGLISWATMSHSRGISCSP